MLPVYKIGLDDDDMSTGVDYNSIVDFPAHMRGFDAFENNPKKPKPIYFADAKKQMVTGVMISEGTLIYRRDEYFGEHYVIFERNEIEKLWLRYNKLGYANRLNEQHTSKKIIAPGDGAYMVTQWIAYGPEGLPVPEQFKNQRIRPGSWMATYKIEDKRVWKDVEMGVYNGFSVEGLFVKWPVSVKKVTDKQSVDPLKMLVQEMKNFQNRK